MMPMRESRTVQQFGKNNYNALIDHTVMVVGVGGVGGYTVEALARFGIKHIIIVDDDIVEPSNINRQLCALESTIGKYKVDVFKARILDINPTIRVTAIKQRFTSDSKALISNQPIDFVVDAIDSMKDKIALIETCLDHDIDFISSMGTGDKIAPESLEVIPLYKTKIDPIARKLRKHFKNHSNYKCINTICSYELPQFESKESFNPTSSAFVPAAAGLIAGSVVIRSLLASIK
jgi:tRNA A37 threonylcarbamoyladenosine dehydratase